MKQKIVLLTEIIAPYRVPVFNELARLPEIDLHVIFLAETDSTQREWLVYKDEIRFSYEVLPSWRLRVGRYHFLLNRGLRRALRHTTPDVLVCGGYNYLASWNALFWARQHRVPFLLWVESNARDRRRGHRLVESLKTYFMRSCQGFIVPGKSSREYLRLYGMTEEQIFAAPDAVDNGFFQQSADVARRNAARLRQDLGLPAHYFLFVGRMVAEKGIFDLLDAYNGLGPELHLRWGLVYVGTGKAEAELRRKASDLKTTAVQFRGFAQREELAQYYGLADAFVFPTHSDPWGLVVNEAMAGGLPVVVSYAAGCAADLVKDNWNGYVIPAGDVSKLAAVMGKLAESQQLREEMGSRGRERIAAYSPRDCAAGIARAAQAFRSVA